MKINKLQKTSLSLLFKAKKFGKALQKNNDPENLHYFRTNLRKLHSIIKDFKAYLEESSYENLNKKIRFLLKSSNKLRDRDVFLRYLEKYAQLIPENLQEDFLLLKKKIKQERELEYKKILKLMDSKEYINSFPSLKEILEKDKTYNKEISKHFKKTKKIVLKETQKKVKLKKESLDKNSDIKTFHELRILFKRLRYLNELFVKQKKSKIKKFKKIQSTLGNIQDLFVQQKMLEEELPTEIKPLVEFLIAILRNKQSEYKMIFLQD